VENDGEVVIHSRLSLITGIVERQAIFVVLELVFLLFDESMSRLTGFSDHSHRGVMHAAIDFRAAVSGSIRSFTPVQSPITPVSLGVVDHSEDEEAKVSFINFMQPDVIAPLVHQLRGVGFCGTQHDNPLQVVNYTVDAHGFGLFARDRGSFRVLGNQ